MIEPTKTSRQSAKTLRWAYCSCGRRTLTGGGVAFVLCRECLKARAKASEKERARRADEMRARGPEIEIVGTFQPGRVTSEARGKDHGSEA